MEVLAFRSYTSIRKLIEGASMYTGGREVTIGYNWGNIIRKIIPILLILIMFLSYGLATGQVANFYIIFTLFNLLMTLGLIITNRI